MRTKNDSDDDAFGVFKILQMLPPEESEGTNFDESAIE